MAINRTAMIDDDGSGTTGTIINNAWKQEFYNQIDALAGGAPTLWTPTDVSGAGLAIGQAESRYCVLGSTVLFWGRVVYPSTSNGAGAMIGGLPFPCGAPAHGGAYPTLSGVPLVLFLQSGWDAMSVVAPNGVAITNAALSGGQIIFAGSYLKA